MIKAIIKGALTILENLIPRCFQWNQFQVTCHYYVIVISPASKTERGAVSTNILGNRFIILVKKFLHLQVYLG